MIYSITHTMQHKTILGLDPGTKEMGLAVLRGPELIYFGVQRLRNGTRPYDIIGQARRTVLATIAKHAPHVVALEEPFNLPTKRAHLLNVIDDELRQRSEELGLEVVELTPMAVREVVAGNPRDPAFLLSRALVDRRQLPDVPGRSRGHAKAGRIVRHGRQ